jgi:DNA-binding FadR family transcriptional regulator
MGTATPESGLTTAVVRAIHALGKGQAGLADEIAERLAEAIKLGLLAPGERLPAEAALSDQLGVATLTLRDALANLRERGLLVTRRGRGGGSFVVPQASGAQRAPGLASLTIQQLRELGDQRQATFGAAAALAARRASTREVEALRRHVGRLAVAGTAGKRRRADSEFGIGVAMAAQSPRLTQEEANLRAELGDLLWASAGDHDHAAAVRDRLAVVEAVAGRKAGHARELSEQMIARETGLLVQRRIGLYRAAAAAAAPSGIELAWAGIAAELEAIFQDLRDTAAAFEASVAARPGRYALSDIASLRPRIHATLDAYRGMAVGTGIVVAPGVVRDAPYWLEWWWRVGGGAPEALRVSLDPDGPDFFDYVNDEWFEVPIRRREAHVAGPYVDYACTNEYAFTLSVPAYHGGRPLGVAAMDIPFDQLERRIMPALTARDAPCALLNASGRVIVASDAGLLPGCQPAQRGARAEAACGDALARLCALTGWTVAPLQGHDQGLT